MTQGRVRVAPSLVLHASSIGSTRFARHSSQVGRHDWIVVGEARDALLAEIGRAQHGVVSRRQLITVGFSESAIGRFCDCQRLRPIHYGVYALGPQQLSELGRIFAALLAIGPDPLLSHQTSAGRRGLIVTPSTLHVSISTRVTRRLDDVVVHRPRRIDPIDRVRVDDLPMTSIPRTLLDLAEVLPLAQLEKVVEAADRKGELDLVATEEATRRYRGHRGCRRLRRVIGPFVSTPKANAGIEREFQLLLRRFGLPIPQVNVLVEGMIVDCWWPEARLVVELDSRQWHSTWQAQERDRKRDAVLLRAGIRSLRITHQRLHHEPAEVARDVGAILALPGVGRFDPAMRA